MLFRLFVSINPVQPVKETVKTNPYLTFNGQCAEAFRLYQQLFGGELNMMTHGDSPAREHVSPDWHDKVMHAQLTFDGNELMGSDTPTQYFEKPQGFSVAVNPTEKEAAERIFNALAEGGQVRMPLGETFWSPAFGMLVDRFGIPWFINTVGAPMPAGATS
jgi:PhnB protein